MKMIFIQAIREALMRELEEALVSLELDEKEKARLIRKINNFLGHQDKSRLEVNMNR